MQLTDFYTPLPKQELFHQSMCPYRLHVGGYGSGKTLNLLMEAIITCLMVPASNSLILRTTSPDLQKTVINKFLNPKFVPKWVYDSYNKNEKIVYFKNGSQLHFGYCQRDEQVSQYLSTEYVFIGLEEAGEFSFRVWEALSGRARASIDIVDVGGNPVQTSLGLTTNPYGPGWAWIKKLFKDKKPFVPGTRYNPNDYFLIHSTVYDNPYICTPEYVAKLEAMSPAMKKKALQGDMNDISGQYYPQFNDGVHRDVHVMNAKDIKFNPWDPKWIAGDWGIAHHFPVLWFTKGHVPDKISGGMRTVNVVYRERIYQGLNAVEFSDALIRACDCERNEAGKVVKVTENIRAFFLSWERFMRTGTETNHSIAEIIGRCISPFKLPKPQAADKNRIEGWSLIAQLLDMDELVITTDCPVTIGALPMLVHDKIDIEDVQKSDTLEDDIGDTLRYGLKSYLNPGNKPESVKFEERLASIEDPFSRQLYAYKQWVKKNVPGKDSDTTIRPRKVLSWQVNK